MFRVTTIFFLVQIITITLIGFKLNAQNGFHLQSKPHSLREASLAFNRWAQGRDLSKTKGWKQFKRFEWWAESRVNGQGNFSFPENHQRTIQELSANRQFNTRGNNNWIPVGPLNSLTPATTPEGGHGVGRINCVAFHPTNPAIYWVGTSNGGVWKTVNDGYAWFPVGDDLPVLRVSDLAVNPQKPDQIFMATGDADGSFDEYMTPSVKNTLERYSGFGAGIYKSEDGGLSWSATNWQPESDFGIVRRILCLPKNKIIAAGLDGIWKSNDGGSSWQKTLPNSCWDIKVADGNENLLFASSLNDVRTKDSLGIWVSNNSGGTWTRAVMPAEFATVLLSRVELATAPNHPNVVYALATSFLGGFAGLFASTDAGLNWELRSASPNVMGWFDGGNLIPDKDDSVSGQGSYDITLCVDPRDSARIFVGGVNHWGSSDGGKTWSILSFWLPVFGDEQPHADHHMGRFQPLTNRYFVCTDGGLTRADTLILDTTAVQAVFTCNADPKSCYAFPTPWKNLYNGIANTEFYRFGIGKANTGVVVGGAQDNGSFLYQPSSGWLSVNGGDGFEAIVDPRNSKTIYTSVYNGTIFKSEDGGYTQSVINKSVTDSLEGNDVGDWLTPYHLHPSKPDVIFAGHHNLWKSEDQGRSWKKISAFTDSTILEAGDIKLNLGIQFVREFDICPSAPEHILLVRKKYLLDPAKVMKTTDGGQTWLNVTQGLPDSIFINDVAYGRNPQTAWVVFGAYTEGQKIYQTRDGGTSWNNISFNLPNLPVNTIAVDYQAGGTVVYIGTDLGVWYLREGSRTWEQYNNNLPNVIVSELEIHPGDRELYAATYGRGIWRADLVDQFLVKTKEATAFEKATLQVLPTANDGNFTLKMEGLPLQQNELFVYDALGRQVFSVPLSGENTAYQRSFHLSHLHAGIYYAVIRNGHATKSAKFLIAK